jgi:1-acyl-sn-glycerol-3-phosphate acyltransferase
MIRTIAMLVFWGLAAPVAALVGFPWSFIRGNVDLLYRMFMIGCRSGVRLTGVRVESVGLDKLDPARTYIFLSNHVSNLDPPIIFPALPGQSSVLLKKSLMRIPILGTAMKMAKFVPVERGNVREAAQRSVNDAAAALRSGLHILIFAEGTRSKDGRLAAFKRGPFYLAMETGAPIVPMTIQGTEKMMRKHSAAVYPGVAKIEFLPAIYPQGFATREELMGAVREAMVEALPVEMRPAAG